MHILNYAVPLSRQPGLKARESHNKLVRVLPEHSQVIKVRAGYLLPGEGPAGEGHGIVPGLGEEAVEALGLLL